MRFVEPLLALEVDFALNLLVVKFLATPEVRDGRLDLRRNQFRECTLCPRPERVLDPQERARLPTQAAPPSR